MNKSHYLIKKINTIIESDASPLHNKLTTIGYKHVASHRIGDGGPNDMRHVYHKNSPLDDDQIKKVKKLVPDHEDQGYYGKEYNFYKNGERRMAYDSISMKDDKENTGHNLIHSVSHGR